MGGRIGGAQTFISAARLTGERVLLEVSLQQLEDLALDAPQVLDHVQLCQARNVLVATFVDSMQERIQVADALRSQPR